MWVWEGRSHFSLAGVAGTVQIQVIEEASMVNFTIAIPTWNGGDRLPLVLRQLLAQQPLSDFTWEVIVVDNNSSDPTREVVETFQQQWPETVPLRYVFEANQGLSFARQRAVEVAVGDWVAFLDDDTIPAKDWLMAAHQFTQQQNAVSASVGAFGGQIHGDYAVPPPEGFQRIASFLAIREPGPDPFRYAPERLSLPPGAGLVIRRQAWLDCIPADLACTRGSGEDFELSMYLHRAGWEIWYNPAMHLTHRIPASRLEREALLKLSRRVGDCVCPLRLVLTEEQGELPIRLRVLAGNLKRLVHHAWRYRLQILSDTVAACEWTFHWHGLLSTLR